MRRQLLLTAASATGFAIAIPYLLSQQGQVTSGPGGSVFEDSTATVRIEFGVKDGTARAWNGSVAARGGEILRVRNWHPRRGDAVTGTSWNLRTRRGPNFVLRAWERERLTDARKYVDTPGVVIDVKGNAGTELRVETVNGSFAVRPWDIAPGSAVFVLGGNAAAHRVAQAERVSAENTNSDFPSLAALPDGRIVAAWVAFRDGGNALLARSFDGKGWGAIQEIARHADISMVKLGVGRQGEAVAVWAAQVNGNWDIHASRQSGGSWSEAERLSTDAQPDIYPAVAADANGNVWVAWQGFRSGKSDIFARRFDGASWSAQERVSTSAANDWAPAIAADHKGAVYVGWDSYDKGNYDIEMRKYENGRWGEAAAIADSLKFEAYVSLACDKENRLWAAWNESGMDWGKDTGFLPRKQGTALYHSRWMAVAVHDGGRWMTPVTPIEEGLPESLRGFNDLPELAADTAGRVWVSFRHRRLRIEDTPEDTPAHRGAWEIYLTAAEGGGWRTPEQVPFSQGRHDMRLGLAANEKGLWAAWPMDNRDFEEFLPQRLDVYAARIPLPGVAAPSLRLRPRTQPQLKLFPVHTNEAEDLRRIHDYTISSGGKNYRIYRGDIHRHTEFSMDGNNDGTLVGTYRYALDAAALDFLMVSDHNGDSGPDLPYINWLMQQTADLFSTGGTFLAFYGYERSLPYPNGHRNVLFTKRGNPTLPIPKEEREGKTGAKMLYEYLKKYNGIAVPHTSASSMGTDWRDNDPEVEPLVEIYQGDRVSAEYEGAPKAANAGNAASAPGGFRPAGYVWNAWAKGYKLGVQASSDHLSTHLSYACTIAADFTREGLVEAMKARHSYGATDNIILDYRMKAGGKEYLQGDIVDVRGPFELTVKIIGTQAVRQVDLIRSNQFLMTRNPMRKETDFSFRDSQRLKGESYYYVRVIQVDDQMAWSSPIWVRRK